MAAVFLPARQETDYARRRKCCFSMDANAGLRNRGRGVKAAYTPFKRGGVGSTPTDPTATRVQGVSGSISGSYPEGEGPSPSGLTGLDRSLTTRRFIHAPMRSADSLLPCHGGRAGSNPAGRFWESGCGVAANIRAWGARDPWFDSRHPD